MIENSIAYMSQMGWFGKTCLLAYSAPIVLWGLGTSEGALRTAFNGVASLFAKVSANAEKSNKHWDQCKKDGGITLSCAAFTALSCIPILGTTIGNYQFNEQCRKYLKIKKALRNIQDGRYLNRLDDMVNQMKKKQEITEKDLTQLYYTYTHPNPNSIVTSEEYLDLPASLIYSYYGFSIAYFALDKTNEFLQVTASTVKKIVIFLSQSGIIKKVFICAANAIKNEVTQTLDDTLKNPRELILEKKQF